MAMGREVYLRLVDARDQSEFLRLMQASRTLHDPWISPPLTRPAFQQYLSRMRQPDHEGLLVCREQDDAVVGVININNIIRGSFLSAHLGYYAGQPFVGLGYMTEGLRQVVRFAFEDLGLHRLEANIQPANAPSINLVKRCGFRHEGFSPSFLYIDGAWRDHERWAIVDDRATLRRGSTFL
jgi:[ribosomal protein S5]-alanine N-acetyltransferase